MKKTQTFRLSRSLILFSLSMLLMTPVIAETNDRLIRLPSKYSVKVTIDRLQEKLEEKGMVIFQRIDHAAGAKSASLTLAPTELLIFGNPKIGTLLMQCSATTAIDLPLKALAYEDKKGDTWLLYNDPDYLAERHQIQNCKPALNKMRGALKKFTQAATE